MNCKFKGIMPALITPLNADGKTVNEKSVRSLVEYHLGLGADGFYVLGSTGEGLVLSEEARLNMIEIVADQVKGRKPIINHIAAMNFEEAVRLAKHSEKIGIDALSAVPPFFFAYTTEDTYKYYKKLAGATDLPFVMYNHPAANGGMIAEDVAKMYKEIDNITGVKWTVNNFYQLMRLKDLTNGEMNIINGPDEMLVCGLAAGADAGIGTTYNVMLPEYLEIYKAVQSGDIAKAQQIQYKVNRATMVMLKHECIPAVKHICTMMGFDAGNATFPMTAMTPDKIAALEKDLLAEGWDFAARNPNK